MFQLEHLFEELGPVKKCFVLKPREGKKTTLGYVTFAMHDDCKAAMEIKDLNLDGVSPNMKVAPDKKIYNDSSKGENISRNIRDPKNNISKNKARLIIRNLSFKSDDISLKKFFSPHGPVAATASPALSRSPRTGLASRGQGQGVQGWKMTCLRPAPPTRSFFQADKRNTLRRKEVEQSSYEDDLQILRVIEAYCVSKHRQTITNSAMLDSTPLLTLADEADTLEDSRYSVVNKSNVSKKSSATSFASSEDREVVTKVDRLEREVTTLAKKLDQETQARKKLQEILMQSGGDNIGQKTRSRDS